MVRHTPSYRKRSRIRWRKCKTVTVPLDAGQWLDW